jgi:hypothetical protein
VKEEAQISIPGKLALEVAGGLSKEDYAMN